MPRSCGPHMCGPYTSASRFVGADSISDRGASQAPPPYNKNGSPLPTGTAALTYFLLYQQFASLSNAVCTGCQFSRASVAQASRMNQSTTTASGLPRIKS